MSGDVTLCPDRVETVRRYYESLDAHDYETLASLLAPAFVHDRPDMTLEGRDRFVRFMREERPATSTSHPVDAVYPDPDGDEVAVRGRLLDATGEPITGFVDVFSFADGQIRHVSTYTD